MRSSVLATAVVVSIAGLLGGCSTADSAEPAGEPIVVGSGSSDISQLLAQLYAGGLRSTGVDVEVKDGLGDRADYLAALDRGEVSMVPDLTGDLLRTFDTLAGATEAEDVFTELNRSLPAGLSVGDYATAEDRLAIAVAPDSASDDGETVAEFLRREDVTVGTVEGEVHPMDVRTEGVGSPSFTGAGFSEFMVYPDAQFAVDDLNSGAVDALAIRTASFGPLAKDLTTLPDDEHVYPAQNVVPLYRNGVLSESALRSFSVVAGELTTADLADMIGEVRSGVASGDVAGRWLGEHNL
ncbi:ABC transporter substrate-binding protein [Rhodococcus sp. 06-412-2C]|uniref:glycine betaine ABC transporter substrate-binding protein n=1 Tax=unclassified Rhodococcus (in: high G+C Gram-positive bacteria) TaxID=192944 RepID=UPI000B9B5BA6|nr:MULTISPECIES: glycine betaine ABC transporter substrate-binding protein [unclassified Rhodococcus (in: high G+C Gram-positive bacteria)]OZC93661.1 ABC transporter substrate-binding protein [Rhodococcus sp. 06-412-2C]OZD01708.1 ABC transporter substrate-binding protein [Rhodococcus sp. 06-412-2B]